jgi:hypothetical protein
MKLADLERTWVEFRDQRLALGIEGCELVEEDRSLQLELRGRYLSADDVRVIERRRAEIAHASADVATAYDEAATAENRAEIAYRRGQNRAVVAQGNLWRLADPQFGAMFPDVSPRDIGFTKKQSQAVLQELGV